jgi:hypothetical protein
MRAETDLNQLLRHIQPRLNPGEYVFCCLDPAHLPAGLDPVGQFREDEGLTLILARSQADQYGLTYTSSFAWITLTVNSSLEVVGLTAAVSTALAQAGISCNVVAASQHDHLFVPSDRAAFALETLLELSQSHSQ